MPIEKEKVGLIILGAEEFPEAADNYCASPAFSNSYGKILSYFRQSLGVSDANILDRFNKEDDPNDIDEKMIEFILARKAKGITDLFIYYTGHGGYTTNNGFLLAIRKTRSNSLPVSSIVFRNMADMLSSHASDMRTFILLDCCFAGAAGYQFQSGGEMNLMRQEVKNHFPTNSKEPTKGVAILCAASKDLPAILVQERNITMFSEGLEKALTQGSRMIKNNYLTLREIQDITFTNIKEANEKGPVKPVRPEVHSPDQPEGDIAEMRHFPNGAPWQLLEVYDINKRHLEVVLDLGNNKMVETSNKLMTFGYDFGATEADAKEIVDIKSDCVSLEENLRLLEEDYRANIIKREERMIELKRLQEERKSICSRINQVIRNITNGYKKTSRTP
jgi:hypothetical protein